MYDKLLFNYTKKEVIFSRITMKLQFIFYRTLPQILKNYAIGLRLPGVIVLDMIYLEIQRKLFLVRYIADAIIFCDDLIYVRKNLSSAKK